MSFSAVTLLNVLALYCPPSKPCDDGFGRHLDRLLAEDFMPSDSVNIVGDLKVEKEF